MDINRFMPLPVDTLERFYETREPTPVGGLEDFLKIPLNPEYAKRKQLTGDKFDPSLSFSTNMTNDEIKERVEMSALVSEKIVSMCNVNDESSGTEETK
jgi:hypothetical protein